jgi:hypothetical protein
MRNTTHRSLATGLLGLALVCGGGGAAHASGGGGHEVRVSGSCSASSHWRLKVKNDDRRLEVQFEVDANRVGQKWAVTLSDNNVRVFSGSRLTGGPSGSFEVEKKIANRPGADRIRAVAMNSRTGERCTAALTFTG